MPETPAWVRDAVFYQVFPDRFASSDRVPKPGPLEPWDSPPTNYGFKGGDLLGIVEHLDHIASVGANALYLTPIFQSASNHRYHTYDYLTVDPLLGGDAALRELLDAAHACGIRLGAKRRHTRELRLAVRLHLGLFLVHLALVTAKLQVHRARCAGDCRTKGLPHHVGNAIGHIDRGVPLRHRLEGRHVVDFLVGHAELGLRIAPARECDHGRMRKVRIA